jgi:hypothetical protein
MCQAATVAASLLLQPDGELVEVRQRRRPRPSFDPRNRSWNRFEGMQDEGGVCGGVLQPSCGGPG